MSLSLELMNSVLPRGVPAWEPRNHVEERSIDRLRRIDGGDGIFSRSYYWQKRLSYLLLEADSWLSDSLTALAYPDISLGLSVGFVPVDRSFASEEIVQQAARGTRYFFGAILYDHRANADPFFSRALNLGTIDEAFEGVPAVGAPAVDIPHTPGISGALGTCWAIERGADRVPEHFITAKHAVSGKDRGQTVALSGGGYGSLVAYCDGAVDAALIKSSLIPLSYRPLPINADPVIGSEVEFVDAKSQIKAGRITNVWVFPGNSDAYDAHRIHFDVAGSHGDSGALVRDAASGQAVGIYTGLKRVGTFNSGMAQGIWQATELLDVDIYDLGV
ncbi:trypsin-like peptidase domain-containing protein [Wenzhouxiangella sp. EGI_FJ10305]|uniref:trypsin-like peptidase domain-containing protein n=1 Tax=Wenzhouxiangella sp. EGI_FJ10305 TaxID=3243768 RepID=UPI0035DD5798